MRIGGDWLGAEAGVCCKASWEAAPCCAAAQTEKQTANATKICTRLITITLPRPWQDLACSLAHSCSTGTLSWPTQCAREQNTEPPWAELRTASFHPSIGYRCITGYRSVTLCVTTPPHPRRLPGAHPCRSFIAKRVGNHEPARAQGAEANQAAASLPRVRRGGPRRRSYPPPVY
jgi:hypothetical protein